MVAGIRTAALVVTMVVAATGCGLAGASPSAPIRSLEVVQTPDLKPDQTPQQSTGEPSPAAVNLPAAILDPIIDDAAARSGVARDQLQVVRAEAVTWPDGGLGCPEPGMLYVQVLVDGFWVVIEADGHQLDYRGGQRGSFRLCTIPNSERWQPTSLPTPGGGAGPN